MQHLSLGLRNYFLPQGLLGQRVMVSGHGFRSWFQVMVSGESLLKLKDGFHDEGIGGLEDQLGLG